MEKFQSICRGCASEQKDLMPLFGTYLDKMMREVTNMEITENDNLPQNVCRPCNLQISKAFLFKELCKKSHDKFLEQLQATSAVQPEPAEVFEQVVEYEEPLKPIFSPILVASEDAAFIEEPSENSSDPKSVDEKKVFDCNVCKKRFFEAKTLIRHHKIHLPKSFKCNDCGRLFADKSNLTKHFRTHTGELRNVVGRPFLCPECGKAFKWRSSLVKHYRHHSKSRIFQCDLCPKYYVEMKGLKIHMLTHTGERPFKCSGFGCQKAFKQKSHLDKHLLSHSGEKRYTCSICMKKFQQKSSLEKHLDNHNTDKKYNCKDCGADFMVHQSLAAHSRTHLKGVS